MEMLGPAEWNMPELEGEGSPGLFGGFGKVGHPVER